MTYVTQHPAEEQSRALMACRVYSAGLRMVLLSYADEAAAPQGARPRDAWAPDKQAASSGGGFGGKQKQARREGAPIAKPQKESHAKPGRRRQLQQQQQQPNRSPGKAFGQQPHSRPAGLVPKRSFFAANGPGAVDKQSQYHREQPLHDAGSHVRQPVTHPQGLVAHPQAARSARPAAADAAGAALAKPTGRTRAEGGRKRRKK